jgi:hypothetical protein
LRGKEKIRSQLRSEHMKNIDILKFGMTREEFASKVFEIVKELENIEQFNIWLDMDNLRSILNK